MACPQRGRLLFIGDSLAVGLNPRLAKMARACGTDYMAVVKGGTGVLYWQPSIAELLATHRPTAVLISLGGNDYWRMEGHTTEGGAAVRRAIPELVEEIRAAGATPLWIRWLIPIPDRPGVDAAWRATGIAYYDTEPLGIPRPSGDPYHPTAAGYDAIADGLWPWLAHAIDAPPPTPSPEAPAAARITLHNVGTALFGFVVGFWVSRALVGTA